MDFVMKQIRALTQEKFHVPYGGTSRLCALRRYDRRFVITDFNCMYIFYKCFIKFSCILPPARKRENVIRLLDLYIARFPGFIRYELIYLKFAEQFFNLPYYLSLMTELAWISQCTREHISLTRL